jgi:hypothetical protein
MRPKRDFRSGSKDNWKRLKKEHKNLKLSFQQYRQVIFRFYELLIDHILNTGDKVKLRGDLGVLTINKYKPDLGGKKLYYNLIDWQSTKEVGSYTFYLNPHTDGYCYYFMWQRTNRNIPLLAIWKFEVYDIHKRKLNSILLDPKDRRKHFYKQYIRY